MAGKSAKGQALGTVFVELSLDSSEFTKSEQKILQSAKATSLNIETNFKNLGTRSDQYFQMMRQSVTNSLEAIKHTAGVTAQEMVRAQQAAAAKISQINKQQYGEHVTFTDKIKKNWQEVAVAAGMAYGAIRVGRELIEASLQMERITVSMKAVTNDAGLAGREIQYLKDESQRLGLVFRDATTEYVKFIAAAKNTALEGEASRKIFTGMSEAITALKLSTQDASLIYMAMTQMVSKGKVSMEELRRQMGERLPGAVRLAAEGLGMTTAELIKQVETGNMMAYDLLPALAEQLHKTYGQAALEAAQTGQAAINRFNNALFETKSQLGDTLMPVFSDVLDFIKLALPYVTAFVGGIKMMTVDLASWVDGMKHYFKNFGTYAFGTSEEIANLNSQLKPYLNAADWAKQRIYEQLNPGGSAAKTKAELDAEAAKQKAIRDGERRNREIANIKANQGIKASEAEKQAIKDVENMRKEIEKEEQARLSHIESINSEIVSLSTEANTFGMTKREAALYQLALKGATTEQYDMADSILKNIEENEKLKTVLEALNTPYDQMTKKIMLASELYQKGAISLEQYTKYTDILAEEMKDNNKQTEDSFKELKDAIIDWGRESADAIVEFCMTGKNSFSDMVNSMIKDIARMVVQQNITGPIARTVSGWFGGGSGGSGGSGGGFNWSGLGSAASSVWNWVSGSDTGSNWGSLSDSASTVWDWVTGLFHSGGVVGYSNVPTRSVSPLLFANAPRLHDGLMPGEYPAILQQGETVLPTGMNINGIIYPFYDSIDYFSTVVDTAAHTIADAGKEAGTSISQGAADMDKAGITLSGVAQGMSDLGNLASIGAALSGNAVIGMIGMGLKGGSLLLRGIDYLIDIFSGTPNSGWYNTFADYGSNSLTGNVGPDGAAFSGGYGVGMDSLGNDISTALGDQLHDGGIVGMTPHPHRRINPAIFANALRLHSGLRADEFPAILQTGEEVKSRKQVAESSRPKQFNLILDGEVISSFVVDDDNTIKNLRGKLSEWNRKGY